MLNKIKKIETKLRNNNQTVSFMESCTGGLIANMFTNIPGASDILKFSAITYETAYKIKMGVSAQTIERYTVYSAETAKEMAKAIAIYANSSYGIGVTGQLDNKTVNDNIVYVAIYDTEKECYLTKMICVRTKNRIKNKQTVLKNIIKLLDKIT